jgi:hypothetical protein
MHKRMLTCPLTLAQAPEVVAQLVSDFTTRLVGVHEGDVVSEEDDGEVSV